MKIFINFIIAFLIANLLEGKFSFVELFWLNYVLLTTGDIYRHFGIGFQNQNLCASAPQRDENSQTTEEEK